MQVMDLLLKAKYWRPLVMLLERRTGSPREQRQETRQVYQRLWLALAPLWVWTVHLVSTL
jgi:hypothetical protein